MKPETWLDSAVFQLTPTRTRCDLVITANGKTEKIASGLLSPFLTHLKSAQDQNAKGGYSITLQPNPGTDAAWFTKGTVERFVRFVSTPEILERVSTIESEMLQIDKAIAIQSDESLCLSTAKDHHARSIEENEGTNAAVDADAEKAIVIYEPGPHRPVTDESTAHSENSKVQLLRVLETRKTILKKELGMAFARAVAAGFEMDEMARLISFAECFGASRLLAACVKFVELWKRKHEIGQWVEIEAEAMSMQSDFSPMNASGIMFSREAWPGSNGDINIESNGKAINDGGSQTNSHHPSSDPNRDKRASGDPQAPLGPPEYAQGQYPHPMFQQWPMHSSPGAPVFQPYPMQGMPYYPNYSSVGPYFQSPYNPMEDPRFNPQRRMKTKRHSMDSRDINDDSEAGEMSISSTKSLDGMDLMTSEKEASEGRESLKRNNGSSKKQSGMVVIRNINYITSKKHSSSGSDSGSASNSETDEETDDLHSDALKRGHGKTSRSSKSKQHKKSAENSNSYREQEEASGNWQAFQSFLLRNEEGTRNTAADQTMFYNEKEPAIKRRQRNTEADPLLPPNRDSADASNRMMVDFDTLNGRTIRTNKQGPDHDSFYSSEGRALREGDLGTKLHEIEGGRAGYRNGSSDDFIIYGREKQPSTKSSMDPFAENGFRLTGSSDQSAQPSITDDSFIIPYRSASQDQFGIDSRDAIDVDTVFPSDFQRTERNQVSYEPDDLSMMPERDLQRESTGHNPAIFYDMETRINNIGIHNDTQEDMLASVKEGKKSDKGKPSKTLQTGSGKKTMDFIRKGRSSKLNPLAEAQARAEKLRAFKADLQKAKKEKEEEEMKRIEALKRERQKRIAARSGSSSVQSGPVPLQKRAQVPAKLSPTSLKGSKFSDSEPVSSSPLQRLSIIRRSMGSSDSQKASKISKINGSTTSRNGLSRSVSSLPELKKEGNDIMADQKKISVTKRLSDPKGGVMHRASSVKPAGPVQVAKLASPVQTMKATTSDPKGKRHVHASLRKSDTNDSLVKRNSDKPQTKISAIMNLDKSKSAALPELKIRVSAIPSHTLKRTMETVQNTKGSKSSLNSESTKRKTIEKSPQISDGDDSLIIEKKVVVLEQGTVPIPVVASEVVVEKRNESSREEIERVTEYPAVWAPPSPIVASGVTKDANENLLFKEPNLEVAIGDSNMPSANIVPEKPYQAPHARASSLEDLSASNTSHCEALPMISSQKAEIRPSATTQAPISNFTCPTTVEHSPEIQDKPRGKESSKGFKRLLKFGRKSHISASSGRTVDLDGSSVDDHSAVVASSEVSTLKSLISEDDPHTESTPPKASRSFSILSPFRIKSSEKKLTA